MSNMPSDSDLLEELQAIKDAWQSWAQICPETPKAVVPKVHPQPIPKITIRYSCKKRNPLASVHIVQHTQYTISEFEAHLVGLRACRHAGYYENEVVILDVIKENF